MLPRTRTIHNPRIAATQAIRDSLMYCSAAAIGYLQPTVPGLRLVRANPMPYFFDTLSTREFLPNLRFLAVSPQKYRVPGVAINDTRVRLREDTPPASSRLGGTCNECRGLGRFVLRFATLRLLGRRRVEQSVATQLRVERAAVDPQGTRRLLLVPRCLT